MSFHKVRWLALIQLYGQASLMAFQFLSVAFFLSAWGAALYGEWLLLTSVPLFFAQLSVGYGAAACPIMARALHDGRGGDASAAFLTALLATSVVVTLVFLCVGATFLSVRFPIPLHGPIAVNDAYFIIAIGFLVACLSLYNGDIYASFYAADHQPLGDFLLNTMFVVDSIVTLVGLTVFNAQPIDLAIALGIERIATSAAYSATSFFCCRALWRFRTVDISAVRATYLELRKPAGGYFLEPISSIMQNQGLVFVTGTIAGPVAAAVMHSHRLLGRVSWQTMAAIRAVTNREVLRLYSIGGEQRGKVASQFVLSIYLWVALTCTAGLLLLGPIFIRYWLHGRLAFNFALFQFFVIAGFFSSMVYGLRAILQINNNHATLANFEFAVTMISIAIISGLLLLKLPLFAVGLCALILYLVCFIAALKKVASLLAESSVALLRGALIAGPAAAIRFIRFRRFTFDPAR